MTKPIKEHSQLVGMPGGMPDAPVKMTGKLMYLAIDFGYFFSAKYGSMGVTAPIRKKNVRG